MITRCASDRLRAVAGTEHFRLHPKGTGVVCKVDGGIPPQEFVVEYLGELVPPWRWFEKQEAVEAAQKHFGQKPTLPDFYNMLMERHRDDSRGYAVLYIDAAERNNFASSLSHSCQPNCRTTVAAIGKRYSVCLYTVRHIEPGEELTIDYSAATENEKEFRSAVCLCGSHACRGSFLYFTGANESQQVLQRCDFNGRILISYSRILNRIAIRNFDILLKNDDFIIKQGPQRCGPVCAARVGLLEHSDDDTSARDHEPARPAFALYWRHARLAAEVRGFGA